MFEGGLVVDLPNIPLASGPVEFNIKLLPGKLIPASSGLAKRSTMQVAHLYVLFVLHTVSSPYIPSLQAAEYPYS